MTAAPRIASQHGPHVGLRGCFDDEHHPDFVKEWSAEDDEPLVDETVMNDACSGQPVCSSSFLVGSQ